MDANQNRARTCFIPLANYKSHCIRCMARLDLFSEARTYLLAKLIENDNGNFFKWSMNSLIKFNARIVEMSTKMYKTIYSPILYRWQEPIGININDA